MFDRAVNAVCDQNFEQACFASPMRGKLRFDVAYFSLFKCNKKRIADYPALTRYMNMLVAQPGVASTVVPRYYVIGYYSNTNVNPTGIIPRGTPANYAVGASQTAAA